MKDNNGFMLTTLTNLHLLFVLSCSKQCEILYDNGYKFPFNLKSAYLQEL